MRGVFDDTEIQQVVAGRDTELTLSPTTLIMLFFGLLALCGVCFGLGYMTGHRATPDSASVPPPAGIPAVTQPESGRPKPSADPQPAPSDSQVAVADAAEAEPSGSNPTATVTPAAPIAAATGTLTATPQVKPAFTVTPIPTPAPTIASAAVSPATPASVIMVQIAAVSQQEDADVLMGALRKRGYEVVAHREPLDGLIHVRIGPFKARVEAEAWRQKLLNDGYNAIVQP
jgi:DedD protein